GAGGRIDAHDPDAAEVTLLQATADVGVVERLVDGLLRGAVQLALGGVVALRPLQQTLALGAADGSSLDAGHGKTSGKLEIRSRKSVVGQHPLDRRRVGRRDDLAAAQPPLPIARLARQDVPLERARPEELARSGLLEPLGGAAVGLQLRHGVLVFLPYRPSAAPTPTAWPPSSRPAWARGSCAADCLPCAARFPPPQCPAARR